MSENLRHQLRSAVFGAFDEHIDKHALKAEGQGLGKVFSYGTRSNLLDRVNDLCKSDALQGVRKVSDVTSDHLKEYLQGKRDAGCTQRTLDEYRSEIAKIGSILRQNWKIDKIDACIPKSQNRGAQDVISTDDWSRLLDYCDQHMETASNVCIAFEAHLGVRVGDLCYGVKDCGDRLEIRSKNGKTLTVPVTADMRRFLNRPEVAVYFRDGAFKAVKDGSVNRQLNRIQDKLGMERHSFHSIRRRMAQDRFDTLRASGVSKSDALSVVSLSLNHGEQRDAMLAESYIANVY